MKVQQMTAPGVIEFFDAPVPVPGPGETVVRITTIGICGSDIHVYHGKHPFTKYPVTQGHEVSGYIHAVGEGVDDLTPGQLVTIEPQLTCGKCHPCRHGLYNLCEELRVMGFQAPGTAAEYFLTDRKHITPLPDGFTKEDGAMIEPAAVAVQAAERAGEIGGKDFIVIGAGPIGNLVMQALKGMGARKVMITDISDLRLNKALECGADAAVNTAKTDFAEAVQAQFGKDGADAIYDCAGTDITINQAIRCARKGSRIVLVAVFAQMANADLAVLNDHGLTLDTTMMYRHEHYLKAIELVKEGRIRLSPLRTKRFPFARYRDAYRFIDENRETTMKVLIDVDEC